VRALLEDGEFGWSNLRLGGELILTDREIQAAIDCKQIIVSPIPNVDAYSSTSLDLTLSAEMRIWKKERDAGVEQIINPSTEGYKYPEFAKKYSDLKTLQPDEGHVIKPHEFVLGWTEEKIDLPITSRLAARVEGKSSLARLGIGVHITAPTIHAGFQGSIQLEIFNHGLLWIRLVPGMRVCQLIFEQSLGTPQKGYKGQFYGQSTTS
jgi:dCTP deaminase